MFQLKDLISAGLYKKEEDLQKDALRALLWVHPEYRLELAIHAYQGGDPAGGRKPYGWSEERSANLTQISLSKAAIFSSAASSSCCKMTCSVTSF